MEEEGRDYFFLTKEEFERRISAGSFWNGRSFAGIITVHLLAYIRESLARGQVVVMDIDIQGARQVKGKMPEGILCFSVAAYHGGIGEASPGPIL
jgi:guanylate kinase